MRDNSLAHTLLRTTLHISIFAIDGSDDRGVLGMNYASAFVSVIVKSDFQTW